MLSRWQCGPLAGSLCQVSVLTVTGTAASHGALPGRLGAGARCCWSHPCVNGSPTQYQQLLFGLRKPFTGQGQAQPKALLLLQTMWLLHPGSLSSGTRGATWGVPSFLAPQMPSAWLRVAAALRPQLALPAAVHRGST